MTDIPPLPPIGDRPMTDREAELAQFMALVQQGRHKTAVLLELSRTPLAKYLALTILLLVAALCDVPAEAISFLAKLRAG
ncbi:hypothetical protein [Sphingopyxis sp. UBA6734]|jgi:hypothetical protein|uniref:hypothetical protein n=1 Tax=Sphingopyxis sp. UBA6734 TaxID=1947539 RepID=UPI0025CD17F9|nr:hypothetical protein [Sphingopyxis sp. UBA6734]